MPGAAACPAPCRSPRRPARRAAGGGGVPAAQPGGGDHRRGQRRADHGGQRVQAADQQRLPLDLGVPEPRALLLVPVDPLLHRVDVDERQGVRAGQQRRPPGQFRQQLPGRLLQLGDVAPGIGAQVRAQRGRGADAAEQVLIAPCRSRPMSSMVSAPAAIPATRHGTFRSAFTPDSPPGRDVLGDQVGQAGALRQCHDRHQAGVRHEIRVIERCVRLRQAMQQSHLQGVLSNRVLEASVTPIIPGQRAPFMLTRPKHPNLTGGSRLRLD